MSRRTPAFTPISSTPTLVALALVLSGYADAAGPKYAEATKRLSQDHAYLRKAVTTDYWKLAPYYLPQHNGKACSVASVTMVLNALRADTELTASDTLYTSEKLLKLNKAFKNAVGKSGKGMDLDSLGRNLSEVLTSQFPGKYKVDVLRFNDGEPAANRKKLVELLTRNESSPQDFVISNFIQGELTGDPQGMIGHLSPVAAYDAKQERVLIFDTDREYYEPYWVSVDRLMESMNTQDDSVKKTRGLVHVVPVAAKKQN